MPSQIELMSSHSDPGIERVVQELNALGRAATFDFALSVGSLIIKGLYGGDIGTWRHRGKKHNSFRRLAEHPNIPMSADSLYRCVAIYELCERLGAKEWKHICTSHCRLVLPLPMHEQERLLKAAESERWPVRQLRQQIAALPEKDRFAERRRGGRKPRSIFYRTARMLRHSAEACAELLDAAAEPSPESCRDLLDVASRLRDVCDRVEQRFATRLPDARTQPPPPAVSSFRSSS